MKFLRVLKSKMIGLWSKQHRAQEFDEELESHLAMHIDDNIRSGMTPDDARRVAIIKLGGIVTTKQVYREESTFPIIENAFQDIRIAIRQMRKDSGFAFITILMLTVGICASVAIFALVDAAVIKPLPYRNSAELLAVFEKSPTVQRTNLSYLDYVDWKKQNKVFISLDAYRVKNYLMNTPTGMQSVRTVRVSAGFFQTLGVTPVLGRDFYFGEDALNAQRTAIISYNIWKDRYGASDNVLGTKIILDDAPTVIVGVLPPDFHFSPAGSAGFWIPLQPTYPCDKRRGCHALFGIGRLRSGVSQDAALTDLSHIAGKLEKQYPDSNRNQGASIAPLREIISGDVRPILLTLQSGAGLLLIIAIINAANLLLIRFERRRKEIAIRTSLGASPLRLVFLFSIESLTLVVTSSVLGLFSAAGIIKLLVKLIPPALLEEMPYLHDLGMNIRTIVFTVMIAIFTMIVFSIAPALRLLSKAMREDMYDGSRGYSGTFWQRIGATLITVELATAIILLASAGLLSKSLYNLLQVDIGLRSNNLATLWLAVPESNYKKNEQIVILHRKLRDRLTTLPGVQSVAFGTDMPVTHNYNTTWLRIVGQPWHGEQNDTPARWVSSDYFKTLGAKLLKGRYFREDEDESKSKVAIINRTMASQFFPNEDPINKKIIGLHKNAEETQIVGVIEDIREGPLDVSIPRILYLPMNQSANPYVSLIVRTTQDENSIFPALSKAILEVEPNTAILEQRSMNDVINTSQSVYLRRSSSWLIAGFAIPALLLSSIGLYGVISYSVSQRTREIGIRMALGAEQRNVYWMIMKKAGRLIIIGIVIGLICSIVSAIFMKALLFGVNSWDVTIFSIVISVLSISALIACFIPARRAASVNPVIALRSE